MSYTDALHDIQRDSGRSVTQQIIDVLTAAIASGELAPGDRLPATRELAGIVGVNHLTAVRAYRRLREEGRVTARVGAGTFVRDPRTVDAAPDETDWQRYALPPVPPTDHTLMAGIAHAHAPDGEIVPLGVGYPPTRLLPADAWGRHTADALAELGAAALQYGPIEGIPALRGRLAERFGDEPDEVLVVNGAMQGLSLAASALIRPGEAVAVEAPTFVGTIEVLRQAGARMIPVPVDEHGLDTEALARIAVREDLRAVFVQSQVHNPTGVDLAPDRAERLVELARRHAFFVVDDEVWAEVRFAGEDPGILRRRAPAHVIALGSVSKTLGGGLRLGWIRASGGMLDRLALAKHDDDLHAPILTQHAAVRFLDSGEYPAHVERVRRAYLHGRDVMLDALDRHLRPVADWTTPAGGCSILVTLRTAVDDQALRAEAERHGVSIVPGSALNPGPTGPTTLRLACGYVEPEAIELGVRRLAQAIRALGTERRARQAFPLS